MKKKNCMPALIFAVLYGCLGLVLSAVCIGCLKKTNSPEGEKPIRTDGQTQLVIEPVRTDTILKYKLAKPVTYKPLTLKEIQSLKKLKEIYGAEGAKLILALNRLDGKDIWRADTLIVPDTITNILSYSPFPYVMETMRLIPKIILVSRKIQAFAAYENGTLVRWGPTSTGRKTKPTPAGLFSMNWKSRETVSTIDSSWVLPFYFNFSNKEGVAIHQFDMPGYPASHSCVRLLRQDAEWFYYWAEQWILSPEGALTAHGTPLIVFDEYRWGKRRPWRRLLEDPSSSNAAVTESEIDSLMNTYSAVIKERVEKRIVVIAERNRKKEEKQLADVKTEAIPNREMEITDVRNN